MKDNKNKKNKKNKNSSHVPIPRMVMAGIRGIRIDRVSAIHNHGSRVMSVQFISFQQLFVPLIML